MPKSKPLRRLNEPEPITVSSNAAHYPVAVHVSGERLAVTSIADTWIVEEGWWYSDQSKRVDRQYFKVVLSDGRIMTIFRERQVNRWFEQDYTHPQDIGVDPGGTWD